MTIVTEATAHARDSKEVMARLNTAAQSIGKIIDVINDIADQTNLLALNTTIEAASAGEVGKGFAVVASEIKELAKQTTDATQEIQKKIEEMQTNTSTAVNSIEKVSKSIENVNILSQTIVSAVEEQNATITEIAKNVSTAGSSTQEIATNVAESAKGLSEISNTISKVGEGITDTSKGVYQITSSANDLSELSNNLKGLIERFKV